ncbi:hypothetical protein ACIQVE_01585 [Pseudomonas sp. NPDC098747]|uniref:hypothetical protein n=1 Tax=Pseudomonas sp. NPDC098747 TaxID=3364487 RepID=UPI00383AE9FF
MTVKYRPLHAKALVKSRLAMACTPLLMIALPIFPAFAADVTSPATLEVIGHAPTATVPVLSNATAPGKNPAVGDTLSATYTLLDSDGDLEDPATTVRLWKADNAAAAGTSNTLSYVPQTGDLDKFLSFEVTPATNDLITDPSKATAPVSSGLQTAPVLPSRAQLASEYIRSPSSKRWGDAYMYCADQGERLPTPTELQTLFITYTRANAVGEQAQADMQNTYGWGGHTYWASTTDAVDRHHYVYINDDGRIAKNADSGAYNFACIKAGAAEGLPTVTGITIPNAAVGTRVTAAYTYNGNATIPDRSRFQWYTATATNGTGKALATGAGATTKTYTPVAADAGKYLMVEITPASYDTVAGTMVTKVGMQIVSILTITGLTIEKPTPARGSFEAKYTTITGGTEADLTYQWYWKGAAINGATAKTFAFSTLTIPSTSAAEELKVEVSKRPAVANRLNRVAEEKAALATATLWLRSSIAWNAPFGQGTWYDMAKTCASQSNGNKRPGTTAELQALVASLGNMAAYGVNTSNSYWTRTIGATQGTHQIVHLGKGEMSNSYADSGTGERGLCVAGTAPPAPALGGKKANGHIFDESNFPTTGFDGAYFEFEGLEDRQGYAYRSTDTSKAIVYNDGQWHGGVTLKAKGSVNIEVYNVDGGNPAIYTINPSSWFFNKNYKGNRANARSRCQSGTDLPYWEHLTKTTSGSSPRGTGTLYSEWGDMASYGWTTNNGYYWTDSDYGAASSYIVELNNGNRHVNTESSTQNTVCRNPAP